MSVPKWFVEETGLDTEFILLQAAYNAYVRAARPFDEWWADHQGDYV